MANVSCTSSSKSNGVATTSPTVSVITHCEIFVQYTACVHLLKLENCISK